MWAYRQCEGVRVDAGGCAVVALWGVSVWSTCALKCMCEVSIQCVVAFSLERCKGVCAMYIVCTSVYMYAVPRYSTCTCTCTLPHVLQHCYNTVVHCTCTMYITATCTLHCCLHHLHVPRSLRSPVHWQVHR